MPQAQERAWAFCRGPHRRKPHPLAASTHSNEGRLSSQNCTVPASCSLWTWAQNKQRSLGLQTSVVWQPYTAPECNSPSAYGQHLSVCKCSVLMKTICLHCC